MQNLSEETIKNIGYSIARVERILRGLSALCRCANDYDFLDQAEVQGIGEVLEMLGKESWKASRSLIDGHLVEELREFASKGDLKKMQEAQQSKKKK